jgi:hypothetical protein
MRHNEVISTQCNDGKAYGKCEVWRYLINTQILSMMSIAYCMPVDLGLVVWQVFEKYYGEFCMQSMLGVGLIKHLVRYTDLIE